MKKKEMIEREYCDECKKPTFVDECLSCGIEHCYECRNKVGKKYPYSLWGGGSREGYFCSKCTEKPQTHAKELLTTYRQMQEMRHHYSAVCKDFDKRGTELEQKIGNLRKENKYIPKWEKEDD